MTFEQQQLLQATLEKQKAQLMDRIDQQKQATETVELDQSRQGRLSRMDALQQQAMAKATLNRLKNQLKQVNTTLSQLTDSDFGYCQQCGEAIEWDRLKINPTLTVCFECMNE